MTTFVEGLLGLLTYYQGGHRLVWDYIYRPEGRTKNPYQFLSVANRSVLQATLSRLKKKGLVENGSGNWKITATGLAYLNKIKNRSTTPGHSPKQQSGKRKRVIIIFDIPEKRKGARDWLRLELTNLDFTMIQKSVWLGPAPLPQKFIGSINNLGLLPYLKFFRATKTDIV